MVTAMPVRSMNPLRHRHALPALALCLAAFSTMTAMAYERAKPSDRVQVTWAPAETLSEVKDNPINRGWLRTNEWEETLGNHLRTRADRLLPPDQKLQVTVNDIHLAGSFEPWRGPGLEDARILKDIYPPRMTLHYRLLAENGTTVREGDAKLWDGSYLQRAIPTDSTDPLRYDKRLIDDWLRKEFGPAKKPD